MVIGRANRLGEPQENGMLNQMEITASELRRRARERLFSPGEKAGYGTYLLGLLAQFMVLTVSVVTLLALFAGACAGLYASLKGTSTVEPTPTTYAVSILSSAVLVLAILYLVGFATWGQRAMSMALMRGGLKASHGLSGWGNGWRMASLILWQQTFVFFWTLLFIVPGVCAWLSYAMAPYLLIDHPDWTPRQCMAESKRLMEGHRWRYFCLNLSFIGWQVLAIVGAKFLGGFTTMLLTPYVDSACAAFYEDLLDRQEQ